MTNDARSAIHDLEKKDLLSALGEHRVLLLRTVQGLDDTLARQTPTASQLCLGGIIKHVALVEDGWTRFIEEGPSAIGKADEAAYESHAAGFRMTDEDTLSALIARYVLAA